MSTLAYVALAIGGGLGMYFGIGGLFELVYYRRRADAERWKIQPHRWPGPKARRREIALGAANMTLASIGSGLFAHHVATGGASSIYWDTRHGVLFSIATAILYFVATDGALYWAHRLLHRRWLFRHIHRVHHRWTSPTAFTSAAMHPLEFALYQSIMVVPLFFLPIHLIGLIVVLVYQNTIALVDHSGVDLRSPVPWQPAARFHDDHHVYFHVNYGQTLGLWDKVFGTARREDREYGEHIFGGKGSAAAMNPIIDTRFLTVYDPSTRPLSFLLLEVFALVWAALTLRHALRDRTRLLTWVTIVVYGVAMELLSYNLTTAFSHGQFTVMFYDKQLPLYVVAIYPVLLYTGIMVARSFKLPAWREALGAGVLIVALDVPFDLAGPALGWWRWSDTDPNMAVRWFGVPVTSFYWHCAFGALVAALTRRPRGLVWALPLSVGVIVGGFLAFLPFHGLHALGVPDGAIVGGALAGAAAAAYAPRPHG